MPHGRRSLTAQSRARSLVLLSLAYVLEPIVTDRQTSFKPAVGRLGRLGATAAAAATAAVAAAPASSCRGAMARLHHYTGVDVELPLGEERVYGRADTNLELDKVSRCAGGCSGCTPCRCASGLFAKPCLQCCGCALHQSLWSQ